ncbi:MAG: hypothetical protein AAFX04_03585 [Pseudomonadota bacterium]
MAQDSTSGTSPPTAFLEYHYYDGGLKGQVLPNIARPDWAPPIDAVGLPQKYRLSGEDSCVEFIRFEMPAGRVTWMGLHIGGIDAQFGDRENYEGIGVWLLNQSITAPDYVYLALKEFFPPLEKRNFTGAAALADDLLHGALPSYCIAASRLPKPLAGLPLAKSSLTKDVVYHLDTGHERFQSKLCAFLLQAQFISRKDMSAPRLLIMLSDGATASRHDYRKMETVDFTRSLLKTLPGAFEKLQDSVAAANTAYEQQVEATSALQNQLAKLQSDNAELTSNLKTEKQSAAHFQEMLSENAENKRHIELVNLYGDLSRQLNALQQTAMKGFRDTASTIQTAQSSIKSSLSNTVTSVTEGNENWRQPGPPNNDPHASAGLDSGAETKVSDFMAWVQRKPVLAGAGLLIAVLATAWIISTLWQDSDEGTEVEQGVPTKRSALRQKRLLPARPWRFMALLARSNVLKLMTSAFPTSSPDRWTIAAMTLIAVPRCPAQRRAENWPDCSAGLEARDLCEAVPKVQHSSP